MHGNIYQLKVLMLFLHRGVLYQHSFRLGTEIEEARKFDDLVFEYTQGSKKVYRFLQVKHTQDEDNKRIGVGNLLTKDKSGEFGLAKYFIFLPQDQKQSRFCRWQPKRFYYLY
ncbi:MAG: hypothetical protein LKM43_01875 [Wolbachia endosymbiont of Penenirmus auritus]|nr:hypothetical protein [Wolbachia endosymbiont of Penenirmus auritus]